MVSLLSAVSAYGAPQEVLLLVAGETVSETPAPARKYLKTDIQTEKDTVFFSSPLIKNAGASGQP